MSSLFPSTEPHASGHLDAAAGHSVYWEACGNPDGKPALVLHGGPGSGCTPWHRRLFDPARYRVVLMDQRGCGRSTPHAGDTVDALLANTTDDLVADIERLRGHLGIERWLVLGGSWGSTLALAYATRFPERVSELVLFGITTGRRSEFAWLFRDGLERLFPAEWEARRAAIPEDLRGLDVVEAFGRLLSAADPAVHGPAALAWCTWESATPDWPPRAGLAPRFEDPRFRLGFARLVTHYVRHKAWLPEAGVFPELERIAHIPAVLVSGRFDLQAPLGNAWALHRSLPASELVVVENAGHAASNEGIAEAIVAATERFAAA